MEIYQCGDSMEAKLRDLSVGQQATFKNQTYYRVPGGWVFAMLLGVGEFRLGPFIPDLTGQEVDAMMKPETNQA